MAVATINWNGDTLKALDPNSCQITYEAGDLLYDPVNAQTFPVGAVATAVNAFLTSHGWNFLACDPALAVGLYAYWAWNVPDRLESTSKKFILLDYRTSGKLIMPVYENISDAGVLLNLANYSNTDWQTLAAKDASALLAAPGKLWIGASARHLVIHSNSGALFGNTLANYGNYEPFGCFETTRVETDDLVAGGYPKYCFLRGLGYAFTSIPYCACYPRTPVGVTTAAGQNGLITRFGAGSYLNSRVVPPAAFMPVNVHTPTQKPLASAMWVRSLSSTQLNNYELGTLYNFIAISANTGAAIGDDIQVAVTADATGEKFFDPDGTVESWWLVGGMVAGVIRYAVPK